ncbi:MAG TPA: ParA family protein [Thermoplasmata archaeon]|nr:ParA family protein [Thermoplasmata archaeon]
MAKKVAIVNLKGGVGKSTITANLAWHYTYHRDWNKKVLVVDLDPQFNVSQYLLGAQQYLKKLEAGLRTTWDVLEQHTTTPQGSPPALDPRQTVTNVFDHEDGSVLDLVPSRLELANSLKNPAGKELLVSKHVAKLQDAYDLILLDCPPTESMITTAAYLTSDYVLIPVKPDFLSSIGLPLIAQSLSEFGRQYEEKQPKVAGVLFNAQDRYLPESKRAKREVLAEARRQNWYVFDNEIRYSRSYPSGARQGRPIFTTAYAQSGVAANFQEVAREFEKVIGL